MIGNMDQFINKGCGNDSYKGGATTIHILNNTTITVAPPPNQRIVIFTLERSSDGNQPNSNWSLKSGGEFIYQTGSKLLANSYTSGFRIGGGYAQRAHGRVKLGLNKGIEIYNGVGTYITLSYYFEGRS